MNRERHRERKSPVERLAIQMRYAEIKAAISAKRARRLQERVDEEIQPNMLEAVALRAMLAKEQEPRNGHA